MRQAFRRLFLCLMKKVFLLIAVLAMVGVSQAANPEEGPHGPGQAIADKIKEMASADFAFVPGGVLQEQNSESPLLDYVAEKSEKISVVSLTGAQILAAIDRSVSMTPSANPSFLQVSGLTVTYRKSSVADRVVSVEVDSGPLELNAVYRVAMPQTMAKGGFGYFTVWDADSVTTVLPATLGSVLEGLGFQSEEARYTAID